MNGPALVEAGRAAISPTPELYLQLADQVRIRQAQLGLTMRAVEDRAGIGNGHLAHLLSPESPSGRRATWFTMSLVVQALFPAGYRLLIVPAEPWAPTPREYMLPRGRAGHAACRPVHTNEDLSS